MNPLFWAGLAFLVVQIPPEIQTLIEKGDFSKAQMELRKLAFEEKYSPEQRNAFQFEAERLDRIRYDFPFAFEDIFSQIKKEIPDVTPDEIQKWKSEGIHWAREIDGETRYFRSAVRNLWRLSPEVSNRRLNPVTTTSSERLEHFKDVLEARKKSDSPWVLPQRFRVHYTLSVKPDVVPEGETIRCWLLYPRECPNHRNIQLITTSPVDVYIASPDQLQRTLYFEQSSVKGSPTIFEATYEFTTFAFAEKIEFSKVKDYDTDSEIFLEFTKEKPPHIVFSSEIQSLAKEIIGDETHPYLKAKAIFDWIDGNIKYTTAPEYSTLPAISQYCALNRTGDCGVQGLLFVTLCRYLGIPARWQSGWGLGPGGHNMHDWAEFYIEPYGWLPVDPSRGKQKSEDVEIRDFYFGNIDHYRLISNGDYSQPLDPPKIHFRSEPVDFQRGEVEWKGGNLYFDQWEYKMELTKIE